MEPTIKKISIIIPAFNESAYIAKTLSAIKTFSPLCDYEVIVVDNGSQDNTSEIASEHGAKVVYFPEGTIAAVRNAGVAESMGTVLVFIDADVLITKQWQEGILSVAEQLQEDPMLVTGSRCEAPNSSSWINKHWFSNLAATNAAYINSGHLITSKVLFDAISGFSASLKTAEDHDFCMKAKAIGAKIQAIQSLRVIHEGYPETIKAFITRERWHGREDFETISSLLSSKVAIIASFHALLLLATLCLVTLNFSMAIGFYLLLMVTLSITLTLVKFGRIPIALLLHRALAFYYYIWGRTLAMLDRVLDRHLNKLR